MPPSSDLPPWLRNAGAPARRTQRRAASTAVFALLLFGAGVGAGFLFARRGVAVATPPPPAPVCPPVAVCPPPAPTGAAHAARTAQATKRKPAAPKALAPLPEQTPMDENARFQALREFANKKGPELKNCIAEPDHGPTLKLGVAFEIASDGAVDFVQILGADNSPKDVKRCYTSRMKQWRFPEELLRGEEKLLVNFVL
jgi:hypothetical protein